LSLDHL